MLVKYVKRNDTIIVTAIQNFCPRVGEFVSVTYYDDKLAIMKTERFRVIEIETILVKYPKETNANVQEIVVTVSY